MIDYLSVVNSRVDSRDDVDTPLASCTGGEEVTSSQDTATAAAGGGGVRMKDQEDKSRQAGSGSGVLVSA